MPRFRSPLFSPKPRPKIRRDTVPLRLSDGVRHEVLRVRDPRARRIRLTVSDNRVRLTLPGWASDRDGELFLSRNREWIGNQLAEQAAACDPRGPLRWGREDVIRLRGRELPVVWHDGLFARAELQAGQVIITAPRRAENPGVGAALGALFEAEARREVARLMPRYLDGLPRAPLSIRIRPLTSLWGSLGVRDTLSLDLALIVGPPAAFEYVLVHELCHLIHGDHSRRFWNAVEKRFPNWRRQRDFLNQDGLALKAELKRVLGSH